MKSRCRFHHEFVPRTAYSTSLTNGFRVSIVKEEYLFCSFPTIIAVVFIIRAVFHHSRLFKFNMLFLIEKPSARYETSYLLNFKMTKSK